MKIEKIEKRILEVEKMIKFLEENPEMKLVYDDIDFEKEYRQLHKELFEIKHLKSA